MSQNELISPNSAENALDASLGELSTGVCPRPSRGTARLVPSNWRVLFCAAAALLLSCGSSEQINCTEDTVLTCDCPEALPGVVECRAGRLTECMCPELNGGVCVHNVQCDDGAFCNGLEVCDPESDEANEFGCRSGELKPACDDNIKCTVDSCNNELNRCTFLAPDKDGDGHGDASCLDASGLATGDDCNDDNSAMYPGNFEVCDDDNVDEDCDPQTFGLRDADGDGAIDDACCNLDGKKKICGDDCNDTNLAVRPLQPEFCDKLDNDCDGDVDEQASSVPWYVDNDADGFGFNDGDVIKSCIPIVDRSLLKTDCNDSEASRHPAQLEICDLADNNCNGLADEGSQCGFPLGIAVIPGAGAIVPISSSSGGSASGGASGTGGGTSSGGTDGSGGSGGTGGSGTGGASAVSLECDSRDITDAVVVTDPGGTFSTWSGVVHLKTNVALSGGERLQIDPDTLVIMDPGVQFLVNGGRLNINGSEELPVKFCGKEATAGYWQGLHLSSADAQSSIDWLLVADAGGGSEPSALAVATPVVLHEVKVQNSGNNGVRATTFGLGSSGLSVTGSAGYAMRVTSDVALNRLPVGGDYTGNVDDYIFIDYINWTTNFTIRDPGVPYLVQRSIDQHGESVITFEPGVEFVVGGENRLTFGWNSGAGTVIANGTADKPIVFRGLSPGRGTWGGLTFNFNLTAESRLSNVEIHGAGVADAALTINSKLLVNNLNIDKSGLFGLALGEKGLAAGSSGIGITNTDGSPISSAANALVSLPADTQISNSGVNRIQVTSPFFITDTGTIPALGFPYYLPSTMNLHLNAIVTLAAGTHFLFNDGTAIVVGYNSGTATLLVEGTATAPVVFDHILSAGGGIPTAGSYSGLHLGIRATPASKITYLEVRNAGGNDHGAIWHNMNVAMPPENFEHISVINSSTYCLYLDNDLSQDYSAGNNSYSGCTLGDVFP